MQRTWLGFVLGLGCLLGASSASAQAAAPSPAPAFPSRPLTAIVPFPAGGPTDVIMRLLAEPIVIETRKGFPARNLKEFIASSRPTTAS